MTWGRVKSLTPAFLVACCGEAFALLSPEMVGGIGAEPAGLDFTRLWADVSAL